MKLKNLIENFQSTEETKTFSTGEKKEILQMISEYNSLGEALSRAGNLPEVAEKLGKIAKSAKGVALSEGDSGWFNSKVVSENMSQLTKSSANFNKIAQDAHSLDQQMTALYEDMGHILGRYFSISEPLNEIDSLGDL